MKTTCDIATIPFRRFFTLLLAGTLALLLSACERTEPTPDPAPAPPTPQTWKGDLEHSLQPAVLVYPESAYPQRLINEGKRTQPGLVQA